MIAISHENGYIQATVTGEFSLADYRELEDDMRYQFRFQGRANILLDLTEMMRFTIDVAFAELRFLRKNRSHFGRVAVVTNDEVINWAAWLNAVLSDAEVAVFDNIQDAEAWVTGAPGAQQDEHGAQ